MRLDLVRRALGVLLLLKAVDFVDRMPDGLWLGWAMVGVVVVTGVLLVADRWHRPAAIAAAVALEVLVVVGDHVLWNHHAHLMALIALVLGVFATEHQPTLLRVQLTVLYGFAAVGKVNPAYLTGAELERAGRGPLFELVTLGPRGFATLAAAAIVVELVLATGLWFRPTRVPTALLGVGFHLVMIAGLSPGWRWDAVLRLAAFAGASLVLYPAFFVDDLTPSWRRGSTQASAADLAVR